MRTLILIVVTGVVAIALVVDHDDAGVVALVVALLMLLMCLQW